MHFAMGQGKYSYNMLSAEPRKDLAQPGRPRSDGLLAI